MLHWATGASEAIGLLELSDLHREVFKLCAGVAREGWGFWVEGVDWWSKEHIKEWRSLES